MADNTETYVIKLKDLVSQGLVRVGNESERTESKVEGLSNSFNRLRNIVAGSIIGKKIVEDLAQFEKAEAVLTNTLGSEVAAARALEDINEFAAKTPFAVDGLTDSFVKLANQGFKPTMKEMTSLGDLASSTGKDFDQLAEALIDGQVGEFERLKEFGIRAKKEGENVKFTFKGVTKQVAFTEDAMRKYILSLGDVQGVSGSMAAISKTTGGQISNLGDKVTQLTINIGKKLKPVISATINALSSAVSVTGDFVDWLAKGSTGASVFAVAMSALAGVWVAYKVAQMGSIGATIAATVAQWKLNAALIANPVGLVIIAVAALTAAVVIAWNKSETFRGVILGLWNTLKVVGNFIYEVFEPAIKIIGTAFDFVKKNVVDRMDEIKEKVMNVFKTVWKFISPVLKVLGAPIKAAFKATGLDNVAEKAKEAFMEGFDAEIERSKKEDQKESKMKGVAGGIKNVLGIDTKGASGSVKKGLGSGISEIKAQAPKNFTININSLVKELTVSTTNLRESTSAIRDEVTKALLMAVNDSQIIAE